MVYVNADATNRALLQRTNRCVNRKLRVYCHTQFCRFYIFTRLFKSMIAFFPITRNKDPQIPLTLAQVTFSDPPNGIGIRTLLPMCRGVIPTRTIHL